MNYTNLSFYLPSPPEKIELSDMDIIRDYCEKYQQFPYYSFWILAGLSISFLLLNILQRKNPYFDAWLKEHDINLNSYLLMAYEMIIGMNIIMMLIK